MKYDTLKSVLTTIIGKFSDKFARGLPPNAPALFPDDEIKSWKKIFKDGNSRMLMEGDQDSELFKKCLPIPKQHTNRTTLFPAQNFQSQEARDLSRRTDLNSLATYLFRRDRHSDLAKLLITFKAISRGREV